MILQILFVIVVFSLGFVTLMAAGMCDKIWFKTGISLIFSALVTMLITFNIFR